MTKTVHSVKLQAYASVDLDRLSYSNGDIVYDNTNNTLRLMDGVSQGGAKVATQTWTNSLVSSFVTNSTLTTTLNAYATTASVSSGYVSNSNLTTTLTGYVTTSNLTTTLTGYVTTSNLTTTLSSYATTASLSSYATTSSLSSYVTSSSLTTTLSSYVTSSSLTTTLSSYATNTNLALKANILNPTFTGTVTAPTAIIGGVNLKAFAIAMGAGLA
jgi:hypothetical protein